MAGIKLHFYQAVEMGSASASQCVTGQAGVGLNPTGSIIPQSNTELRRSLPTAG